MTGCYLFSVLSLTLTKFAWNWSRPSPPWISHEAAALHFALGPLPLPGALRSLVAWPGVSRLLEIDAKVHAYFQNDYEWLMLQIEIICLMSTLNTWVARCYSPSVMAYSLFSIFWYHCFPSERWLQVCWNPSPWFSITNCIKNLTFQSQIEIFCSFLKFIRY